MYISPLWHYITSRRSIKEQEEGEVPETQAMLVQLPASPASITRPAVEIWLSWTGPQHRHLCHLLAISYFGWVFLPSLNLRPISLRIEDDLSMCVWFLALCLGSLLLENNRLSIEINWVFEAAGRIVIVFCLTGGSSLSLLTADGLTQLASSSRSSCTEPRPPAGGWPGEGSGGDRGVCPCSMWPLTYSSILLLGVFVPSMQGKGSFYFPWKKSGLI